MQIRTILSVFYTATVQSIIMFCITSWFGNRLSSYKMATTVNCLYFSLAILLFINKYKTNYEFPNGQNIRRNHSEMFEAFLVLGCSEKVNFCETIGADLILSLTCERNDIKNNNNTQLSPSHVRGKKSTRSNQYRIPTSNRSFLLLCIIVCGDVHPDPGPNQSRKQRTPKTPCTVCGKWVVSRSRQLTVLNVMSGRM